MTMTTPAPVPEGVAADAVLQCIGLGKHFDMAGTRVDVLHSIDFRVHKNESVAIMGTSGCGKSTLLHLLGGLDQPSSGKVLIAGQNLQLQDGDTIAGIRNRYLGFVYQFHHLLPDLTALENVIMPLYIAGMSKKQAAVQGMAWLEKVSLAAHANKKPGYLSGGERQRVAIARALIHAPQCVLADEPTANLDAANAKMVLDLLLALCAQNGSSLVLVTHDADIAAALQRQVRLVDGRLAV